MTEREQQLVEGNIKLVYFLVGKLGKTEFVSRNKDDLTSEGTVGLIKAARAFDPTKGVKFATFASRCINNEMLMFIRRNKKHEGNLSLYTVIGGDEEGRELLFIDALSEEETNIEKAERIANAAADLAELTARLTEREKQIVDFLRQEMTQRNMAAALNLSQSYISRLICKIRKKYKRQKERWDCG